MRLNKCSCLMCSDCNGTGMIRTSWSDAPDEARPCGACHGGIIEVCEFCAGMDDEPALVRNRLINAAPKMYGALKAVAALLPLPLEATRIGEIIKPAIDEAEGES